MYYTYNIKVRRPNMLDITQSQNRLINIRFGLFIRLSQIRREQMILRMYASIGDTEHYNDTLNKIKAIHNAY